MSRDTKAGERRVVPFSIPPSRRSTRGAAREGSTGTILLFTGVRYERQPAGPEGRAGDVGPDCRLEA